MSFPIAQAGVRVRERAFPFPAFGYAVVIAAAVVLVIAAQNFLLWRFFPHLPRLTTDFSSTYLQRELLSMSAAPHTQTVFLGDSVLWGYAIDPDQSAVSLMQADGCDCLNLSFKASSPPNYYALARLMQALGARPRAVVIEMNQKVLNQADSAYSTLFPAVKSLAVHDSVLTANDIKALGVKPAARTPKTQLERMLSRSVLMYAMRSDVRETWYGDPAAPLPKLTQDLLMGTYDLTPLDTTNTGVAYLNRTFDLFRAMGVPVIAFTTPTNHTLMHAYIDGPDYQANDRFLIDDAKNHGARTLDLDRSMPARVFIDESHLTPAGQIRLAKILAAATGGISH